MYKRQLLEGVWSNRDAIGSRIVLSMNGSKQTRVINTAGSYLASNDKRAIFGMGNHSEAENVTIYWTSGRKSIFKNLKVGHYYKIKEDGTISAIVY